MDTNITSPSARLGTAAFDPEQPPKIAVAVRSDLAVWQKLNVVAFLASGVGAHDPRLIGSPYEDANGVEYLPMLGHPVIVLIGDRAGLQRGLRRARERSLTIAVYIDAMFATGTDADNRATVRSIASEDLDPAGFSVVGPRREVDRALDRLSPHP